MSNPIVWYSVSRYSTDINSCEVLRDTPSYLFVKSDRSWRKNGEQRISKTGYDTWFKSWAEAHAYLLERAQTKLHDVRQELREAEDEYKKVKEMVP